MWLSPPPPAPTPGGGGGSGSATYPSDDVHQARNDEGIGGWGYVEEDKWERSVLSVLFKAYDISPKALYRISPWLPIVNTELQINKPLKNIMLESIIHHQRIIDG